ncbi:MAG: redoxin domain-containing protein, partial [Bacteroidales bacterium]
MKQLLLLSSVATLAVACSSSPKGYSITGNIGNDQMNGQTVYLYDLAKGERIDSTIVDSSTFVFKGTVETPSIYQVQVGRGGAVIIAENAPVQIDFSQQPTSIKGEGLNATFGKMQTESSLLSQELRTKADELKQKYASNVDSFQIVFAPFYEKFQEKQDEITNSYLNANKDNMIGVWSFLMKANDMGLAQIDSMLKEIPMASNFKHLTELRTQKENLAKTQAGAKFVDFKGTNLKGETVSLSDYAGKGQYVLVDFWASWCGPCKRQIPYLKEIYNTYSKDGLVVLGVNVWDSKPRFEAALEEEGMTWPNIYASDNNDATDLYG